MFNMHAICHFAGGRVEVLADGKCCYGHETAYMVDAGTDPYGLYDLCDEKYSPPPSPPSRK